MSLGVGGDRCMCGGHLTQSEIPPAWRGPHLKGYFRCLRCGELCPRIMLTDEEQGGLSPEFVEAQQGRQRKALTVLKEQKESPPNAAPSTTEATQ